ncbi:hypothetical protein [Dolichospermum circinale]|uniref:hypothetical protein n=1 Tax=Dolichospermum circinale TaxID=109265 RepID=UPI000429C9A1|nr:hypothetical protein [Dolichospermum circinale]MDB9454002.1 hypothetical protein [Dolichospermum circinale CS-541/06]MDB9463177.1 hypothetical protein [Dolichospermum circinale CS-541/04]MDB9473692.1 hypothetical protein [Dolichospermum circinale CS-537/11]MDB9479305.1 hypothetical protein [Dolichospermum circinale CS-537/03]MDB9492391.1 hypothetical protein [Dolichospermum circinale CS-534/05]
MDPITLATAITTIFLTGVLQKQGENFSDILMQKVGKALDFIRKHSPDTAAALAAGNPEVLSLNSEVLAQIPSNPIFAELVATADVEKNTTFQEKYQAAKAGGTINIIGKQINISQDGSNNTQNNTFGNF